MAKGIPTSSILKNNIVLLEKAYAADRSTVVLKGLES